MVNNEWIGGHEAGFTQGYDQCREDIEVKVKAIIQKLSGKNNDCEIDTETIEEVITQLEDL